MTTWIGHKVGLKAGAGGNHWVEQCENCRILGEILGLVAPRKSFGYATKMYNKMFLFADFCMLKYIPDQP